MPTPRPRFESAIVLSNRRTGLAANGRSSWPWSRPSPGTATSAPSASKARTSEPPPSRCGASSPAISRTATRRFRRCRRRRPGVVCRRGFSESRRRGSGRGSPRVAGVALGVGVRTVHVRSVSGRRQPDEGSGRRGACQARRRARRGRDGAARQDERHGKRHSARSPRRPSLDPLRSGAEDEAGGRGAVGRGHRRARGDSRPPTHFAAILRASESELLQERALDLEDLGAQIVRALYGLPPDARPPVLREDAVVVAGALAPSQLIALEKGRLKGIVLAQGGATSHAVILARALGIPCVTGVSGVERWLADGEEIVVDGERGLVVARSLAGRAAVLRARSREARGVQGASGRRSGAARGMTTDGARLEVAANVSIARRGAPGVRSRRGGDRPVPHRAAVHGPRRSLPARTSRSRSTPRRRVRPAAGRVIIRTLDVGGDKPIPYLASRTRTNPFLGCRGVRMYDEHPGIVAAQLRAILRASAHGNVKLMFPMVSSLEEVRALRRSGQADHGRARGGRRRLRPAPGDGHHGGGPLRGAHRRRRSRARRTSSASAPTTSPSTSSPSTATTERVARLYERLHPAFLRALAAGRRRRARPRQVGRSVRRAGRATASRSRSSSASAWTRSAWRRRAWPTMKAAIARLRHGRVPRSAGHRARRRDRGRCRGAPPPRSPRAGSGRSPSSRRILVRLGSDSRDQGRRRSRRSSDLLRPRGPGGRPGCGRGCGLEEGRGLLHRGRVRRRHPPLRVGTPCGRPRSRRRGPTPPRGVGLAGRRSRSGWRF